MVRHMRCVPSCVRTGKRTSSPERIPPELEPQAPVLLSSSRTQQQQRGKFQGSSIDTKGLSDEVSVTPDTPSTCTGGTTSRVDLTSAPVHQLQQQQQQQRQRQLQQEQEQQQAQQQQQQPQQRDCRSKSEDSQEELGGGRPESSTSASNPSFPRRTVCQSLGGLASKRSTHNGYITFEMNCDMLCIRTMTVSYVDQDGMPRTESKSGYNVKVLLHPLSTDIEVSFSVVGGTSVYKIDRNDVNAPWVKDQHGMKVPERFTYSSDPPQHVQYFIRGPSCHSWVSDVDERNCCQSLLEMISRDFLGRRTMHVAYTDRNGQRHQWSGTGYKVKCHLTSDATDVEVSFSVLGGRKVCRVDRRDPAKPWIEDANGYRPLEVFQYEQVPPCVRYDIRGMAFRTHISNVFEQNFEELTGDDSDAASLENSGVADPRSAFEVPPDEVPSIGGIVELAEPHSEFLLPAQVALFEPSRAEIFHDGSGMRQIFLNTPLTEEETLKLGEMHKLMAKRGVGGEHGDFPKYMAQHALRMIQSCKGNVPKAVEMMKTCVKERVRRMPLTEAELLPDLRSGFMYWHGRDRKCRPCLVIRVERFAALDRDKERVMRLIMFTLEYALRYAMVPGRVENWVVIIDLQNVFKVVNPMHVGSMASLASAMSTMLEKVYCGRMVWIKIINMPGGSFMSKAVNGVIPSEKRDKVNFPENAAEALKEVFEPNQLERRYGGTAPDLEPQDVYPYHFFPNPCGDCATKEEVRRPSDPKCEIMLPRSLSEVRDSEDFSLHANSNLAFHEGLLWDTSSPHCRAKWEEAASQCSLPPAAAAELSSMIGREVEPCRDISTWLEIVNPAALQNQRGEWSVTSPLTKSVSRLSASGSSSTREEPIDEVFDDVMLIGDELSESLGVVSV